jgi:multiple sugar transport system substrate-binding protein
MIMKRNVRILSFAMAVLMTSTALTGCNGSTAQSKAEGGSTPAVASESNAKDTITALLPPVSPTYQKNFEKMEKDFNALYPNLTLKIEPASWEDLTQKLDTQVQAGSPPDISFIGSSGISKYVESGLIQDISKYATKEMLGDFDEGPLNYMKSKDGLYGFPAYMEIHGIGGNKEMLEAAGIDWKAVQEKGWTFDQFREAVKKGVVKEGSTTKRYGFVFACSGVAARDYLSILVKGAGMPAAFNTDLKYAYTSKHFLSVLKGIRTLIDDGSMPKELGAVDAGKRWNMFLTGQTMITGKGLSVFENSANVNNKKLESKDAGAVKDSIKIQYISLPMPTFDGFKEQSAAVVDGYVSFRGKQEPKPEHVANVTKALYFLASGQTAAQTNSDLFVAQITKSSKEAAKSIKINQISENAALTQRLISVAAPARPDIPTDLGAKAIKLEDEVMIPKLQALLANEITPEQMHEALKAAAIEKFGQDGIVKD